MIFSVTNGFPKVHFRRVSQMNDAARSSKQNIREGYRRDTLREFMPSIKISLASLEELEGDVDDCYEDGLIQKAKYDELKDIIGKTK